MRKVFFYRGESFSLGGRDEWPTKGLVCSLVLRSVRLILEGV